MDGDYNDPPSTPTGYQFVTSIYSSYHDARGYLFQKSLGEISYDTGRRVQFSAGTAIGVVLSIIEVFINSIVALTDLLKALGTGLLNGAITSYVDSKMGFANYKTLYKGFCHRVETLDTYQVLRYVVNYDFNTRKEYTIYYGHVSGFRGTHADLAYQAIVNY